MREGESAHYGITKYSDLTEEEFARHHLNKKINRFVSSRMKNIKRKPSNLTTSSDFIDDYQFTRFEDEIYRNFYSKNLMAKNLNFIPMKMDW